MCPGDSNLGFHAYCTSTLTSILKTDQSMARIGGGVPTAWLAQQCELSYIQNGLRTMKKKTSQTPTSVPGVQARVAYSKQLATVGPLKPSVLKCDTHVTHNGTVETDSNWVQKPCMSQGSLSIRAGKLSPHCLSQHAVHLNAESVFTWHLSVP